MTEAPALRRRVQAVAAISCGTALVVIDGAIATVALPTIARDLHVDPASAVSVVTVYQLVLVMLLLPFSGLGDRIGLKRLYQIGQLVFTAATILCFFAKSLPFLLIVRAAQAMGAAATLSVASALIRRVYPPEQLGRGLGINSVVVSSAAALAPTLGGLVLAVGPWPWVFASAVPFAILSLLLGRALPESERSTEPFDLLGALLCAAMFGLVIGGLESAVHGDSPVVSAGVVAAGLIIAILFVRRERDEPRPILPIDLLSRPVLALSTLGAFTAFIATMTTLLSLPFRLQHVYGFAPSEVGAVLAPWPLTTMIVAPLAGALSDRYPAGALGGIGMAVAITGLVSLAFLPADPSWFDIAWRMSLSGGGFGLFLSPNARLIIGSAPVQRAAAAGGLISTTRMVGQTTGATLVAALLAMGLGGGTIPPLTAAALALVAGLCSIARLNPAIRNPPQEETAAAQPAQVR
ncbi:MFS transporter [Sphingomonas xinjiangensis]|uniref:DHA2 family multidrug resistance protein-like MFS transporter n=1 Tax=Sphingomonas xinjiangensis TaxID=643568 RepID=A0A840Y8F9_9SPHN|nr:MFS transporter [Sphingomonas xinjiangensis]MBB5709144.1 DHA2 family multidrug resistance protein-like MFS transporter [Sphingomonas xinjiangensis]